MRDRALDRLFRRFRDRGDGAALAAVFDSTARELLDVACHLCRDAAAAEDLVQETFLAAIRGAERYDGARPVKGWLYGILWRAAAKARREAARAVEPDRLPERREPGPHEGLVAREVPEVIERALHRLPRRYREVLAPVIHEGRTPEQIARDLRRSPGTVRSQIHRGLERLRRALPRGIAPASGLTLLPASWDVPLRGMAAIRSEVLGAAGFSPTLAAGAPALALSIPIGATLMSKTTILAGAALALTGVALWSLNGGLFTPAASPSEGAVTPLRAADARTPRSEGVAEPAVERDRRSAATDTEAVEAGPASPAAEDRIAPWLARFNEAPEDWRHGWAVARQIAALPPDEALAIMTGVWPHLSVAVKKQALKPFVFGRGHPHALPILHLAATDESLPVQGRALGYLEGYAFQDFSSDYDAYLAWVATYRDRPLAEVLRGGAQELARDLQTLTASELAERILSLGSLDLDAGAAAGVDLAAEIREAGGLAGLTRALQLDDREAAVHALSWSRTLGADEMWLRTHVLPGILIPEETDPRILDASLLALGRPDCDWAREPLLGHLRYLSALPPTEPQEGPTLPPGGAYNAASALAEIGNPAAIPALIQVLADDRSGRLDYAIGYYGLAQLTGVQWNEECDAAWWLDWWDRNAARLPVEARAVPIDTGGQR